MTRVNMSFDHDDIDDDDMADLPERQRTIRIPGMQYRVFKWSHDVPNYRVAEMIRGASRRGFFFGVMFMVFLWSLWVLLKPVILENL